MPGTSCEHQRQACSPLGGRSPETWPGFFQSPVPKRLPTGTHLGQREACLWRIRQEASRHWRHPTACHIESVGEVTAQSPEKGGPRRRGGGSAESQQAI